MDACAAAERHSWSKSSELPDSSVCSCCRSASCAGTSATFFLRPRFFGSDACIIASGVSFADSGVLRGRRVLRTVSLAAARFVPRPTPLAARAAAGLRPLVDRPSTLRGVVVDFAPRVVAALVARAGVLRVAAAVLLVRVAVARTAGLRPGAARLVVARVVAAFVARVAGFAARVVVALRAVAALARGADVARVVLRAVAAFVVRAGVLRVVAAFVARVAGFAARVAGFLVARVAVAFVARVAGFALRVVAAALVVRVVAAAFVVRLAGAFVARVAVAAVFAFGGRPTGRPVLVAPRRVVGRAARGLARLRVGLVGVSSVLMSAFLLWTLGQKSPVLRAGSNDHPRRQLLRSCRETVARRLGSQKSGRNGCAMVRIIAKQRHVERSPLLNSRMHAVTEACESRLADKRSIRYLPRATCCQRKATVLTHAMS